MSAVARKKWHVGKVALRVLRNRHNETAFEFDCCMCGVSTALTFKAVRDRSEVMRYARTATDHAPHGTRYSVASVPGTAAREGFSYHHLNNRVRQCFVNVAGCDVFTVSTSNLSAVLL
eukprot:147056-Prymnesium_polylepis.1